MCGHERVCTPACVSVCVCVSVWRDEGVAETGVMWGNTAEYSQLHDLGKLWFPGI